VSMRQRVAGTDLRQMNKLLKSLLENGRLETRTLYRDYYDSCHPPTETPDAPWVLASISNVYVSDLKACAYGPSLYVVAPGVYELSTSNHVYQLRIKGGV